MLGAILPNVLLISPILFNTLILIMFYLNTGLGWTHTTFDRTMNMLRSIVVMFCCNNRNIHYKLHKCEFRVQYGINTNAIVLIYNQSIGGYYGSTCEVDRSWNITKTCLYNFDHLKPHFYIVKLGFTGVYFIFLIFAQKHRLWVLVRTASPRPTIYDLSRNMKNFRVF